MREISGWILEDNVRPFVDILASLASYNLDEGELDYIRHGLDETDSDAEPATWLEYRLAGKEAIEFRIARESGTSVVMAELVVPNLLSDRVQLILDLLSTYHLGVAKRDIRI